MDWIGAVARELVRELIFHGLENSPMTWIRLAVQKCG
jgi:hypothetical protein